MKTEDTGTKKYRAEITRLRSILNMVADIYQYPQVKDLILNRDIPPNIRSEFKVYSDAELKRFNEFLAKVDIQTARVMTIHQMLGTRISDTLTLRTDCLMEQNGEILIRIYQMKTHYYEKPISQELAALIREAIRYTEERYGKCKYIFTNENDHTKPMMLEMLREFLEKDEERSILISSHISSDLESLCDDLYMIHDGKIILHEDTDVLLSDYALLKVDAEQYSKLDKQFILRSKKETYGYSCLTNQKQYYMENYPKIAIEKGTIDEVITMMIRGTEQ